MNAADHTDAHTWWSSLKHHGMLIAPSKLIEFFPKEPLPLAPTVEDRLRRALTQLGGGDADAVITVLDTILEDMLGLGRPYDPETGSWLKGNAVPSEWTHRAITGEAIKPRRLWQGRHEATLPVFVDDTPRLGVGRSRRAAARVTEWLRRANRKIALLTNAHQWRLVYAGLDYDAYAEADTALWLTEGSPGPQVTALRSLLSLEALTPVQNGALPPLLAAIEASRKGQAELSAILGERVRRAVELLIREHGAALDRLPEHVSPRHIYLAATRVVMRLVVMLFAEARDLLPRDHLIYYTSYSFGGLREALESAGGGSGAERLQHRYSAWPRVLALFHLIFEGSAHEALPILRYGGGLFAPGDLTTADPVQKALVAFEDAEHAPSDATIYRILELLTKSPMKVRQGRATTWIQAPVDFADLSSEYIGILYEGLLDFELHRVEDDDAVVFLALGDEPALPVSRLEAMSDAGVASLIEKFQQKKTLLSPEVEENAEEEEGTDAVAGNLDDEVESDDSEVLELPQDIVTDEVEAQADQHEAVRARTQTWARRAVIAGKLVKKPRSKKPGALREYETQVEKAASRLVSRVVVPGEWFLVRFGGTRKGSGTFYTRPQLAVPTVQRTLRPLAYNPPLRRNGQPDDEAPAMEWSPKPPEDILRLKVCDQAMGSGSFLVASLRFLTDALLESLYEHERIQRQGDQTLITLADGHPTGGRLVEEYLKCRPDDERFEALLRAQLKRHIVDRCIYGVDLDPLAVELGRLALWIETMDKELPFEFLDHKLKVGNSLVGCWFDHFRDYPALAWEREGGDKNHTNGVHFAKEAWTKAIKKFRNERIKPELCDWITGQQSLLNEIDGRTPETLRDEALAVFEVMQTFPVHHTEERAEYYREFILGNPSLQRLKAAFDTWCAIWFWPAERIDEAPTPLIFENPPESTRVIVQSLALQYRFFHWELEFPDVFASPGGGFDAIVGNPPWETLQPNSKEYFSNLDPLYRTYGNQEASSKQKEYFQRNLDDERAWLEYNTRFKSLANWYKQIASPFGDGADDGETFYLGAGSEALHRQWKARRGKRKGYADPQHPFQHQGEGKAYTYKMFIEQAHAVLCDGGHIGLILPSGIYTDKGTTNLRTLFLTHCRWRWLFGIINWNKIFVSLYYRFKFCIMIIQKGGRTSKIMAAFSRYHIHEWEEAEQYVIPYPLAQIERLSPNMHALLEIRERRDLDVMEKVYANSVLLGDKSDHGWQIRYTQGDFNMTSDSRMFPPRPKWESDGYKPDEYGRWLKGQWSLREASIGASIDRPRWEIEPGIILSQDGTQWIYEEEIEDVALPLYEGRMIGQFDFSEKGWVSGKGRGAVWREIPWDAKIIDPQFLMASRTYLEADIPNRGFKVAMMDVTSSTNARTAITAVLNGLPCGHKIPTLTPEHHRPRLVLALAGIINSFTFDFVVRSRLGGQSLIWAVLEETALLPLSIMNKHTLDALCAKLALAHPLFSPIWLYLCSPSGCDKWQKKSWKYHWSVTLYDRLRVCCMLDAIIAELYGLDWNDLAWILRECDRPVAHLHDSGFYRTLDPKGFWRVDKEKDPELRHTVLTLTAFRDLKDMITAYDGDRSGGIEAFCNQNDGDGWMLPETLRLADLGLGHDERAKDPQPVRERLGKRFLLWQVEQTPVESWAECELHARNILGPEGFPRLQAELRAQTTPCSTQTVVSLAAETLNNSYDMSIPGAQRRLFPGEPTLVGESMDDPPPRRRGRRP